MKLKGLYEGFSGFKLKPMGLRHGKLPSSCLSVRDIALSVRVLPFRSSHVSIYRHPLSSLATKMSANNALKLGRISVKNTAILICDIQEKFRNGIGYFPQIVTNTKRILDASKVMEIPVAFTEQYPKGLGATVPELAIETYSSKRFEKTQFSMCTPEMKSFLANPDIQSIILCGIEAHACIRQTAMDLIEAGYDVHVVVDCCSSRNQVDRKYAFKHLQNIGAFLTTTESVILSFAPNAAHPKFKELQKIIRDFSADTGLVSPSPKAVL